MSRIGKMAVKVPSDVMGTVAKKVVSVKGKNGDLSYELNPGIKVDYKNNEINIVRENDDLKSRELHGLTRTLINNMVIGLTEGFRKELEINGVGFKVEAKGSKIVFNLGYSHPIYFYPPAGIKVNVHALTKFSVEGIDKELVGRVAAKLRGLRPPEPYKGKGVKYADEAIIRKAGKTGKK